MQPLQIAHLYVDDSIRTGFHCNIVIASKYLLSTSRFSSLYGLNQLEQAVCLELTNFKWLKPDSAAIFRTLQFVLSAALVFRLCGVSCAWFLCILCQYGFYQQTFYNTGRFFHILKDGFVP